MNDNMSNYEYPKNDDPLKGTMFVTRENANISPVDPETVKVFLKQLKKPPEMQISNPRDVMLAVKDMDDYDREHMKIIYLDGGNHIVGIETSSIGILNTAPVHPREMLKGPILANAMNIVLVHNHPSGSLEPSLQDIQVTNQMCSLYAAFGIHLLDSVIVAPGDKYVSIRALGKIKEPTSLGLYESLMPYQIKEGNDKCDIALRAAMDTLGKYCESED